MSAATATTEAGKGQIQVTRGGGGPKAIMELIASRSSSMAAVATKYLTPEKLMKMVGVAMTKTPKLGLCTPMSVLNCAMACAELGLSPGVLGEAYLIPYKEECTLVVGYRGLLKLARRSGTIATIQAEVVREGDEFHWRLGLDAALSHQPKAGIDAPMTHAWAMVKFKDGSFQFTVMRAEEVGAIRSRSRASSAGPWVTDTAEMWKKTAIRRLCKLLPLTPEVEEQIAKVDETEFSFDEITGETPRPRPTAGSIASTVAQIAQDAEAAAAAHEEAGEGEEAPTEDEKARKDKFAKQAEELKTACSPGKKGCAKFGGMVKKDGNDVWVCEKHMAESE